MLKAVTLSRKGEKSERNEDACLALSSAGIFVVADGVGGNPSGEQASRHVVDTLYENLSRTTITRELIDQVIAQANRKVYGEAGDAEAGKGMASTLVLAWLKDSKILCFNVGDSRIYRFRKGSALQLTTDHVKSVRREDRSKMLVTRAIGLNAEVIPDISEWDWQEGDVLLLTSDGISDRLADEIITKIVTHQDLSMADKANMLIEESVRRGGRDDKTVVLVF